MIEERIEIERAIVMAIVEDALERGHTVRYYTGEPNEPGVVASLQTSDSKESATDIIMVEVGSTDEETLSIRDCDNKPVGFVSFVFGNDGHDVIADHTVSDEMTRILARAVEMSDRYAEGRAA